MLYQLNFNNARQVSIYKNDTKQLWHDTALNIKHPLDSTHKIIFKHWVISQLDQEAGDTKIFYDLKKGNRTKGSNRAPFLTTNPLLCFTCNIVVLQSTSV